MSVFWAVIGFLVTWKITSWVGRRQDWEQRIGGAPSRHRPCRHHRPGDAKRQRIAREQARDLVAALGSATHDPIVHLAAGVVLEDGRGGPAAEHGAPRGVDASAVVWDWEDVHRWPEECSKQTTMALRKGHPSDTCYT